MALAWTDGRVEGLSFGHATPQAAHADVCRLSVIPDLVPGAAIRTPAAVQRTSVAPALVAGRQGSHQSRTQGDRLPDDETIHVGGAKGNVSIIDEAADDPQLAALVARLQAYARGAHDDFLDIAIDLGPQTAFQRRVIECCRRIPLGQTLTYGALAEQVGHPRAARAVGNCMRTNRIPLLVPCHRVIGSGGTMRGYSAGEGIRMKLRLLEMEASGRR